MLVWDLQDTNRKEKGSHLENKRCLEAFWYRYNYDACWRSYSRWPDRGWYVYLWISHNTFLITYSPWKLDYSTAKAKKESTVVQRGASFTQEGLMCAYNIYILFSLLSELMGFPLNLTSELYDSDCVPNLLLNTRTCTSILFSLDSLCTFSHQ